jgi:hypothetical protein
MVAWYDSSPLGYKLLSKPVPDQSLPFLYAMHVQGKGTSYGGKGGGGKGGGKGGGMVGSYGSMMGSYGSMMGSSKMGSYGGKGKGKGYSSPGKGKGKGKVSFQCFKSSSSMVLVSHSNLHLFRAKESHPSLLPR